MTVLMVGGIYLFWCLFQRSIAWAFGALFSADEACRTLVTTRWKAGGISKI